jgi:hypothetical protein
MLTATRALRTGFGAARLRGRLLLPLAAAEMCAALAGLVPGTWLALHAVELARTAPVPGVREALVFGTIRALLQPTSWGLLLLGALLAAAGGMLVRAVVHAGAAKALANQVGRETAQPEPPLSESLLDAPERWLATRGLALVLQLFATTCAVGSVVLGMAYFKAHPGPLAALLMTIATLVVVLLPMLDAALDLGFVRSVLVDETPGTALANGLLAARRHSSALLPAWYAFALAELAVAVAVAGANGTISAAPGGNGRWVLLLAPRMLVLLAGALAQGLVALARLGVYVTILEEDAGTLPAPPPPEPPPVAERVLEAVAVAPAPVTGAEPVHEAVVVAEEIVHEAVAVAPPPEQPRNEADQADGKPPGRPGGP